MGQLTLDFEDIDVMGVYEDPRYLSEQIITYIGNKRQLLPLIEYGISLVKAETGKAKLSCLDLFSGSGIVSRMLKQHAHTIYANDLEAYSELNTNRRLCLWSKMIQESPKHTGRLVDLDRVRQLDLAGAGRRAREALRGRRGRGRPSSTVDGHPLGRVLRQPPFSR